MLYNRIIIPTNNYESRQGYKPIVNVFHITDGAEAIRNSDQHEEQAVKSTFTSPESSASANDVILRDGTIEHYVDIDKAAWTQGLGYNRIKDALSPIVREMNVNPNLYCISYEFEAYSGHGGYGDITEAQFWAGLWLVKKNQVDVKAIYGNTMQLNSSYVIGHCHIDPIQRKFDPGPQFPWTHFFSEFTIIQNMTLDETEQYILSQTSPLKMSERCFQTMNEVSYLKSLADNKNSWAIAQLSFIAATFEQQGIMPDKYSATGNWGQFHNDVLYIYNQSVAGNGYSIGLLNKVYPILKTKGLVA